MPKEGTSFSGSARFMGWWISFSVMQQPCSTGAAYPLGKPLAGQSNTVMGQGREVSVGQGGLRDPHLHTWCNFGTYLGRPWRDCARTIVMQNYLDDCIDPRGWLEFDGRGSDLDLSYAEYDNRGPGSATYGRVKWKGYRVIHSLEAYQFRVREFIYGDWWIPAIGVVIL
ncbi:pectinesterase/pectinesterase inhibitor-like isoform X1 [Gossypium hirsutum]|uniref:Pectinesterase/pectinesterase inhibitor-like isoform X1 n=1 Tax=Gossypium hirsutum TaxID=3635 RepID=A0ABM2Z2N7_GOSHI|nr:pectinesterase/pectinesterase inhibitor-like isoform X1 [Gossypium hirsutum]